MRILKILTDLFTKSSNPSDQTGSNRPANNQNKKKTPDVFPFTDFVTFGAHLYRSAGERCDISFIHPVTGEKRLIVDNLGMIHHFPGIVKEDFWMQEVTSKKYLEPIVRFRTSFEKWDETRYIMLWQIQPDGRYWEDEDGFGAKKDLEITLYAFIDQNGEFMGPFRVYRMGMTRYLHRDEEQ